MKTLKQACTPRPSIFDATKRDTVLSLNNLTRHEIKPQEFFEENHLTQGMRLLLENGFKRLEGKTEQGVFRLTQSMGGGKTHNLIAFGLLARHPEYRKRVMESFYVPETLGQVRVVAFSGRESDAPYGVWGAIAEQLGKKEFFNVTVAQSGPTSS
jgi:predicted AAA+ superfamily ATPase